LTYQKTDETIPFYIPENIVAEKGNMYNPIYRNSEKFYNFSLEKNESLRPPSSNSLSEIK